MTTPLSHTFSNFWSTLSAKKPQHLITGISAGLVLGSWIYFLYKHKNTNNAHSNHSNPTHCTNPTHHTKTSSLSSSADAKHDSDSECEDIPFELGEEHPHTHTSVKPGINEPFLSEDPAHSVDFYIHRFEVESREARELKEPIVSALPLKPGDSVCDLGAGTGLYMELLSERVGAEGTVYCLEIAPKFIQQLERRTAQLLEKYATSHGHGHGRGPAKIVVGECTDTSLRLPERSLDLVFAVDAYHHFEHPFALLRDIHASLRVGGFLAIVDYERIPGVSSDWVMGHVRADKQTVIGEITKENLFELHQEVKCGLKENYFLIFKSKPKSL